MATAAADKIPIAIGHNIVDAPEGSMAYKNKPLNKGTLRLSDPRIDSNSAFVAIAPMNKAIIRFISGELS